MLGIGLLVLFALGASRTIYVGDSGELTTAVYTLGIPHPPGYPLYVMLGKLFTVLVPLGSIAFRLSLMSAVCAALTGVLLFVAARRLGAGLAPAVFSVFVLAASPSFWSQANIQRVYTLNTLFLVATLLLAMSWYQKRRTRDLFWMLFVASLGAGNHLFLLLVTAALILLVTVHEPKTWLQPRKAAAAVGAVALGLSTYLYLPLRSRADPALDWGDPETLDRFLQVVLRRDFWHRRYLESTADLPEIVLDWLLSLFVEQPVAWALALPLLGLLFLIGAKGRSQTALSLISPMVWFLPLVIVINVGSMALHGSRSDLFYWHRYYLPSYVVMALLAGLGLQLILSRLPRRRVRQAAVALAVLAASALLISRYQQHDRSHYRIAEDYSRALLAQLPPGASLAATDDNVLFVLLYLHYVEGVRPDIRLIQQGVSEGAKAPLRFDPQSDALYFTHHPNWNNPNLQIEPWGLAYRVVAPGPPGAVPALDPVTQAIVRGDHPHIKSLLEAEANPKIPKDYLTRNLLGQSHFMRGVTLEAREWPAAQQELLLAQAAADQNDVLFYNVGLIYRRNGLHERALEAFERSHQINPRSILGGRGASAWLEVEAERKELERLQSIEQQILDQIGTLPDGVQRHLQLAQAFAQLGEAAAARGHQLRALELRRVATGAGSEQRRTP